MAEQLLHVSSSLSLSQADRSIDHALHLRLERKLLPLAVVVLDLGGNIVSFQSEDSCGLLPHDITVGKAWASRHGNGDQADPGSIFEPADIPKMHWQLHRTGRLVPTSCGVLILDGNEMAIAAVGISGDASDKDEYCAIEAIRAAGIVPVPPEPTPGWGKNQL